MPKHDFRLLQNARLDRRRRRFVGRRHAPGRTSPDEPRAADRSHREGGAAATRPRPLHLRRTAGSRRRTPGRLDRRLAGAEARRSESPRPRASPSPEPTLSSGASHFPPCNSPSPVAPTRRVPSSSWTSPSTPTSGTSLPSRPKWRPPKASSRSGSAWTCRGTAMTRAGSTSITTTSASASTTASSTGPPQPFPRRTFSITWTATIPAWMVSRISNGTCAMKTTPATRASSATARRACDSSTRRGTCRPTPPSS